MVSDIPKLKGDQPWQWSPSRQRTECTAQLRAPCRTVLARSPPTHRTTSKAAPALHASVDKGQGRAIVRDKICCQRTQVVMSCTRRGNIWYWKLCLKLGRCALRGRRQESPLIQKVVAIFSVFSVLLIHLPADIAHRPVGRISPKTSRYTAGVTLLSTCLHAHKHFLSFGVICTHAHTGAHCFPSSVTGRKGRV